MPTTASPPVPHADVWYFAYGSNLDPVRKEERTSPIRYHAVTACYLPDYRLAFNKFSRRQGYCANVIACRGDRVYGVCYRCNPDSIKALDVDEGLPFPTGYRRRSVLVVPLSGLEPIPAETYVFPYGLTTHPEYRPTGAYLNHILDGIRHHRLPEHARDAVRQHAMGLPEHLR